MKTFRIDDVSVNTDTERYLLMVDLIRKRFPPSRILAAVSPCVHTLPPGDERVFPAMLNVEADFRVFYRATKVGVPRYLMGHADEIHAHGIVHVDHRLLSREAQELSILLSCSLTGATHFTPPFHKYDADTEAVCREHKLTLIKRHEGMRHLKYHKVVDDCDYYYFHTHDFGSISEFEKQLVL